MRKITVDPKIPTAAARKSSVKAGLVLNEALTGYQHTFRTGMQIFLMANVAGEVDVGKNLSQAIYGIVSNKFGNVAVGRDMQDIGPVEVYLVPRLKRFEYSPPFTGYNSHTAEIELETEIFSGGGRRLAAFTIEQRGSRSMLTQVILETNYEMAQHAVNEAINNLLEDFARKLDELY